MAVAVMALWSLFYGAPGLHAAQPYATDDARLLACQSEVGKQENRGNRAATRWWTIGVRLLTPPFLR
jgi:hypothetical protein